MEVKEAGGEVSASVAETNRVRALLGLAPLKGTVAAPAAPAAPAASDKRTEAAAAPTDGGGGSLATLGPSLPQRGVGPPSGMADAPQAVAPKADPRQAVLGLTLDRYTKERPVWR